MKVLIIGAAGMIGRKLAERLCADNTLRGQSIDELMLADVVEPIAPAGQISNVQSLAADLTEATTPSLVLQSKPDVIYHLAAIVSGEAEANFDKGYTINLDGTRNLFEAIRTQHNESGYCPRVIFASSIAVFGAPFEPKIADEFHLTPLTSYGTQKAIGELLLADFTRRGIFDGLGLRFPTICIRPGKPNKAASGFFSNILREPINGLSAVLPVSEDVRHWFASPRAAVEFCLHAAALDGDTVGPRRNMSLPGLSATVGEQIESLGRVVGSDAVNLIKRERDDTIEKIVAGWPTNFETRRAQSLGFAAETSFDEIINVYLADESAGILP